MCSKADIWIGWLTAAVGTLSKRSWCAAWSFEASIYCNLATNDGHGCCVWAFFEYWVPDLRKHGRNKRPVIYCIQLEVCLHVMVPSMLHLYCGLGENCNTAQVCLFVTANACVGFQILHTSVNAAWILRVYATCRIAFLPLKKGLAMLDARSKPLWFMWLCADRSQCMPMQCIYLPVGGGSCKSTRCARSNKLPESKKGQNVRF